MHDAIMQGFLRRQRDAAIAFAAESDRVNIVHGPGEVPTEYLVHYDCRCLIRDAQGEIREHEGFGVRIGFPPDYLRRAEPYRVVNWVMPMNVWQPNILGQAFAICVGRLEPGQELIDLIYQCHAIGTWNKATVAENDALNKAACAWARSHPERFPVDRRPLKRNSAAFVIAVGEGAVAR